eukprot:2372730-Pyramimonas_sp.AAC.1
MKQPHENAIRVKSKHVPTVTATTKQPTTNHVKETSITSGCGGFLRNQETEQLPKQQRFPPKPAAPPLGPRTGRRRTR